MPATSSIKQFISSVIKELDFGWRNLPLGYVQLCISTQGRRYGTIIGVCILIYAGYARLISFEINFISKETSRAEPEYMNIATHPN